MLRTKTLRCLGLVGGLAAFAGATQAQSFINSPGKIPQGNPFNNSLSENIDFGDVDQDGDWDAIFADGGDGGNDQNRIWMNNGGLQGGTIGTFTDETSSRFPVLQDDSRDIEFVDFDDDGDLDIYTSNTAQLSNQGNRWWTNNGGAQGGTLGNYSDETGARWVGLNAAASSIPNSLLLPNSSNPETFIDWSCDCDFGDLDNDGDMDLVHSTYGGAFGGQVPTRIFLNDGDGFFEEFNPSGFKLTSTSIAVGQPGLWCEGTQQTNTGNNDGTRCDIATSTLDIDLGDTDGDFDLDILHGDREQAPRFFLNRLEEKGGTLGFRDVTTAVYPAGYSSGDGHYEQEMGDLDGDGDLDIYGLNWQAGGFSFNDVVMENNGSGTFINLATLGGSGADDNEGDFLDYDNDGDLDLFVANFSGANKLYRNNNNGGGSGFSYTAVNSQLPSVSGLISLDADIADVDADGDYDIFESNDNGAANRYFENVTQIPDTHAPYIPAFESLGNSATVAAFRPVRAHVYDNAPYYITWYNPTSMQVTIDGTIIPDIKMKSMGGQIFRANVPGNYVGDVVYSITSSDEHGNSASTGTVSYTGTVGVGALGTTYAAGTNGVNGVPTIRTLTTGIGGMPHIVVGGNVPPGTVVTMGFSRFQGAGLDLGNGMVLHLNLPIATAISGVADANGEFVLYLPNVPSGTTAYAQFLTVAGTGGNDFAVSPGLELTWL